jgi:hypothetical protein
MSRRGVVIVRVVCPRACRATATLSRRSRRVGRATGVAKAGRTVTLRVRLSARGRALVRRHQPLTLRLSRRVGDATQTAVKALRVRR